MPTLRELVERGRRQIVADRAPGYDRPTSLYAAGSVGNRERAVARPAPEPDGPPPRQREFALPTMPTEHVEDRPHRAAGTVPRRRVEQSTSLRTMLRSSVALRRAMVVHEVLGPPVALRDDR